MTKWIKRLGLILLVPLLLILVGGGWFGYKIWGHSQVENQVHLQAKNDYLKSLAASAQNQEKAKSPNIIFILYDDLGYGDLGATGSKAIKTPVIDDLATGGVQLNNFYAPAPVCSPSRAGFLTGRLPLRAGLPSVVFPTGSPLSLVTKFFGNNLRIPAEEITLADMLKASGYKTGMVGKWHMGDRAPSLPNNMGFEDFYGALYSNDMEPFALYDNDKIDVEAPADQTKLNTRYTAKAVEFIDKNSSADKPFFLYFAHNFPHLPLYSGAEQKGKSDAGLYGDVVEGLDWGLGQIVTALKANGQFENTLIIITSDNGPWFQGSPGSDRGRKGNTYEGGMHVPFIAHWPKGFSGGKTIDGISMGTDLVPTIMDWLNIPAPTDRLLDGKSIRPMIEGQADSTHEYIYYFTDNILMAVRDKRFKYHGKRNMVYAPGNSGIGIPAKKGPWLFDTSIDYNESYDVSEKHAADNARLQKIFEQKRQEMEDNLRGWVE